MTMVDASATNAAVASATAMDASAANASATATENASADATAEVPETLTGVIIGRRCLGKNLAFCDILVVNVPSAETATKAADNDNDDEPTGNSNCDEPGYVNNADKNDDFNNNDVGDNVNMMSSNNRTTRTTTVSSSSTAATSATTTAEVVQVAFRRSEMILDNDNMNFPIKATMLRYGAILCVQVRKKPTVKQNNKNENKRPSSALMSVIRWKLITDPKQLAEEKAASSGGVVHYSYSTYLKERADHYFRYHPHPSQSQQQVPDKEKKTKRNNKVRNEKAEIRIRHSGTTKEAEATLDNIMGAQGDDNNADDEVDDDSNNNDDSRRRKEQSNHPHHGQQQSANKAFAKFLLQHVLVVPQNKKHTENDDGIHVLDIAGGKGHLSKALAEYGIQCTVIDPWIRKKQQRQQRKNYLSSYHNHLATHFNMTSFCDEYDELLQSVHALVAFHPDQVTEDVLDVALRYNKTVAIVPCCVFPRSTTFLPQQEQRINRNGQPVHTYTEFVKYLLEKDDRLQCTTLQNVTTNRNQVIYRIVEEN